MRFSTLQENVYGVGLPQDQLPCDADKSMMATTEHVEASGNNTVEEGSMVSNLPLLFANGYPTSLEKITLAQLERFITFMVQCSLGYETTKEITKPHWWPKEVKFSNPLHRPKTFNDNWLANLKKLVFRCYTYHRSEYLLRFCSFLARYPHEELEYVNNWDSTTSLYHKSTGKLLVTFRNENMNYDKKYESPRRKLLSHNGVTSGFPSRTKQQHHSLIMVEPPTEDIYLCDNCDAEFVGLEKMKEHEQTCCERDHSGGSSRPITPDLTNTKPEEKQNQFLEYFHLRSANLKPPSIVVNDDTMNNNNSIERRTSRRVRGCMNFTRCQTIPFSSPAGIMLAKKSKSMTADTQQERLERIERHLIAPVLNNTSRPKWLDAEVDRDRWIVTHKPNRDKTADEYVHEYKFVNSVRRKPMLSIQSQLLYIVCRPVYVVLTRLSEEEIDELKRVPPKYRCAIQQFSVNENESRTSDREKARMYVPSKRKAPGDPKDENKEMAITDANRGTLNAYDSFKIIESAEDNATIAKPSVKQATVCTKPSDTITLIDLCSSDEDDDLGITAPSDENRDPMNTAAVNVNGSLLQKFISTNHCSKARIYPADVNSQWLPDNVLSDDGENCTNKYRSTVTISKCAHLSPILRPAP